jgi:hypothetical protein
MKYLACAERKRRGDRGRRRDHGRGIRHGSVAVLAGLVTVVAVGCSSPSSSPSSKASAAPSSTGGVVNPSATSGAPVSSGEPVGTGQQSGVTGGALFGGDVPLTSQTSRLGRHLAIVRTYYLIGEQFPDSKDKALMASGSTLLVSFDSAPGKGGPSYASIAAGQHDAVIKRFLQQVEQAAVTYHLGAIYMSFEHEADGPRHFKLGPASEFIAAWDHMHALAVSMHLDWNDGGRIHWVLILTHEAYVAPSQRPRWAANVGQASDFFPGKSEVDIIGVDGYNSGACTQSIGSNDSYVDSGDTVVGPQQLFTGAVDFAKAERLPLFIAEWGSVPYSSPDEQPGFINSMQGFVTANSEVAAALYWNSQVPGCNYSLNGQPESLAALATMGHAPRLQGHIVSS